jgi:hypothetical protein
MRNTVNDDFASAYGQPRQSTAAEIRAATKVSVIGNKENMMIAQQTTSNVQR